MQIKVASPVNGIESSPVNSAMALKNRPLSVMVTGKGTVLQKAKVRPTVRWSTFLLWHHILSVRVFEAVFEMTRSQQPWLIILFWNGHHCCRCVNVAILIYNITVVVGADHIWSIHLSHLGDICVGSNFASWEMPYNHYYLYSSYSSSWLMGNIAAANQVYNSCFYLYQQWYFISCLDHFSDFIQYSNLSLWTT